MKLEHPKTDGGIGRGGRKSKKKVRNEVGGGLVGGLISVVSQDKKKMI